MAIETRVKDLAEELGVGTKEIMQHLRDLGVQAKSQMTTLDEETVANLRSALKGEGGTTEVVERQTSSGVIVRRRRKTARKSRAEEPKEETTASAPEAPEAAASEKAEPAARKKAAEKIAKPAKEPATPQPEASAKIISTPGDAKAEKPAKAETTAAPEPAEAKAEPVKTEEAEAPEAKAEPKPAKTDKPEAKPAAAVEKETPAEEAAPEAPAAEAPAAEAPAAEAPAEAGKAAADESAESDDDKGGKKKKKKKAKKESPQVRIISRPDPAEVAARETKQRVRNLPEPKIGEPSKDGPVPPKPERDAKKKRRKDRRVVEFAYGDSNRKNKQEMEQDRRMRTKGKGRKRGRKNDPAMEPQVSTQPVKASKRKLRIEDTIRLQDMAKQLGVKAQAVIKVLFGLGIMATINQALDFDTATVVAAEFGYEVENVSFDEQEFLVPTEADKPEDLKPRPPVVTIMGHVDHGKTSLLDAIRSTNITSGEAGGITQHIGAYHVTTDRGEIVFLDTPGHEAFTTMRARGAEVTDIVILVVAADDGVMDQTREAIAHSKAAGVPIVVAVNKIDKEDANPDNVKRELAEFNLVPEDWGGDTIFANVSAKQKIGLDELLELVLLQAEVLELKANPDKPARGHIVEAKLDKGRGPVGTVLIQEGTVSQGDAFVCGVFHGKVRAMFDDQGNIIKTAGPAIPVEVQGFDGVPEAGDEFSVVSDDKVARRIAQTRQTKLREKELAGKSKVTLESFLASRPDEEAQTLNLVLKADVQGSLEAVSEALQKLSTDEVKINVVHGAAGAITESDILLASASQAIIIGFNIRPEAKIKEVADREDVEIRFYDIIYKLTNEIKDAMSGMLAPDIEEVYLGQAEVRQTFSVPKVGTVAGCAVSDGKITRHAKIRLLRDGVVIYTGELNSLKRFKDDAKEVAKGYECGMGLTNYNDIKVGDIIEAFEEREVARTI